MTPGQGQGAETGPGVGDMVEANPHFIFVFITYFYCTKLECYNVLRVVVISQGSVSM